MANVFIDEAVMASLASLLREFTESENKYFPADMPPAFRVLLEAGSGGSEDGPVLVATEIFQNGVFVPGEGIDGYNMVTVNVPTSGAIETGIVVNQIDTSGNWVDVIVYGEVPANLFKGNTALKKVVLTSATSVPVNAFDGCTALTSVTLSGTTKTIGNYAFRNCTSLAAIDIPAGVTSIGNYAFYGCTALTSVTIPGSVTSIGTYAFYNDTALASVVLNEGLKTIDDRAFQNCTSLVEVDLPDGLTTIGDSAFYLASITEITIPSSVTKIENYAFGETPLERVYWNPVSLSSVGSYSYPIFAKCAKLTDFIFADGVTVVPANVLCMCTGLKTISFPDSVKTINGDAFQKCTALETAVIPAGVTTVGVHAFTECTALKTVYWNPVSISAVGSSSYPPFNKCSALTDFIIGENVTVLPERLLQGCTGLVNIVIPDNVKTVGASAFYNCTNLLAVQVGTSNNCAVTSIGKNAFNSCANLTDITIHRPTDAVPGSPWGATNATVSWVFEVDLSLLQEVEYIESDGTSWIGSDVFAQSGMTVTMDAQYLSTANSQALYGGKDSSSSNRLSLYYYRNSELYFYFGSSGYSYTKTVTIADRHTYKSIDNILYVDDVQAISATAATFTGAQKIAIFACNTGGTIEQYASARLYSMQFEKDGVLIRDFVPAKCGDLVGLYDRVGQKFYANCGAGTLVAGPAIEE